jgi:hypothetical protein
MGRASSTNGGKEIYNGILAGKPEGKRPLRRPSRRGVDDIKMDFRVIGWSVMNWADVIEDRDQWRALVNTIMNFRVP